MKTKLNKGLHQRFSEMAKQFPERAAVSFEKQSLSYRALDQLSDRLAMRLIQQGIGNNTFVGLCMERSVEMIIGLMAILKAGGIYVPIDPQYPEERIRFIVEDAQLDHILVDGQKDYSFLSGQHQLLPFSIAELEQASGSVVELSLQDFDLAYMIYTSGTTGTPKGVLIDHQNVGRLFEQTESWFDFSERDVWTLFHSICFDFSVWEIWGALLYGGQLIVVPYSITRSPHRFYQLVSEQGVTVLSQTPSAFEAFTMADQEGQSPYPSQLRYVVFGGEALHMNRLRLWTDRHGLDAPQLINMYGITETTVHVTYKRLSQKELDNEQVSPIGTPIPDLDVYLLNKQGEAVRNGEIGELYIGGPGLSRGYHNRPALTEERFVNKTLADGSSRRLYKTGDKAVFYEENEYIYIGRTDDQIKLNGFRIEPGELESICQTHPEVFRSVVLKKMMEGRDVRLVNYVLPKNGLNAQQKIVLANALTNLFNTRVPKHMRPQHNCILDELPLNANGKLDRKALLEIPLLDEISPVLEEIQSIDQQVLSIWQDILATEDIPRTEDFFDIGGTSLDLIRLINQIESTFSISLDLARFMDGLTLDLFIEEVKIHAEARQMQDIH